MRKGFKSWCETQAEEWRRKLELQVHEPLPARQLADQLLIDVIEPGEIPDLPAPTVNHLLYHAARAWSAVTVSVDGCTLIIFNPRHSAVRQESDIMHELAHVLCQHEPCAFHRLPNFPFPLREYRKDDEEEAEWLGGCLQIPRKGLLWALRHGMKQEVQLACHFCASEQMVRFRRSMTGVDKQLKHHVVR